MLAGQAFVVQEHGDAVCDGLVEGLGEVISGLGKRRLQTAHLIDAVVDGVRQIAGDGPGSALDLRVELVQIVQHTGAEQVTQAPLGIQVRLGEGLGKGLVPFGIGLELLVLLGDIPQNIEGGPPFAFGIIEFDARDLGRCLQVVLVGEQAQRGVHQRGQALRLFLHQGKLLDEGQALGIAQSGALGVDPHAGNDGGKVFQLRLAQTSGHGHLVQQLDGHTGLGKIKLEAFSHHTQGTGQLFAAGPGDGHSRVDGLDGFQGLRILHPRGPQVIQAGLELFDGLARPLCHGEEFAPGIDRLLGGQSHGLTGTHQPLVQIGTVDDGLGRLVADAQARDAGGIATGQGLKAFPGLGGHAIEAAQAGTYLPGHARYGRRKGLGPGNEIAAKIKREGGAQVRHDAILFHIVQKTEEPLERPGRPLIHRQPRPAGQPGQQHLETDRYRQHFAPGRLLLPGFFPPPDPAGGRQS